ncbi:MAG: magnesium chelatase domain-containing protein [Woeseiaceae bacterium]|nr:magnesium chelatase domain-containing protein [Woeseiaceae bacterium]
MSVAFLRSRAQLGVDAPPVTIEVFLSGGLPVFSVVGMPETAVRESKDRVRGALVSSGFNFPQGRITASLGRPTCASRAGASISPSRSASSIASRQLPDELTHRYEFFGELGLNGELRRVPGTLPAALRTVAAGRGLIVPRANLDEASLAASGVHPAGSLLEVVAHLNGSRPLPAADGTGRRPGGDPGPDLLDVRARRSPSARWRSPRPAVTTCC